MEFTHSSLQTKSTNTYQLTSENIPLIRKPLCQITNLPSPQSPALCKYVFIIIIYKNWEYS